MFNEICGIVSLQYVFELKCPCAKSIPNFISNQTAFTPPTTPNQKVSVSALDTLKNIVKKDKYSEIRQEVKDVLSEIRFTLDVMSITDSDDDEDNNNLNINKAYKKLTLYRKALFLCNRCTMALRFVPLYARVNDVARFWVTM